MFVSVTLIGYRHSVYSWIATLALAEKGLDFQWQETDPFVSDAPPGLLALNPFKRVPVLLHGDVSLYETVAITRYVDEAFSGPLLQPDSPIDRSRQSQILSIIDSYVYWPLVRQVFANGFFAPHFGEPIDEAGYQKGLAAAPALVQTLAALKTGETWLLGASLTLADIHLYPMLAYFAMVPAGAESLRQVPGLDLWRQEMAKRPAVIATTPEF
jgi:glutathione S-transferase